MQLKNNPNRGVRFRDITNQRFGKLVALEPFKKPWSAKYFWKCKCDCGRETDAMSSNLVRGTTTSCGCYGRNIIGINTKQHGLSKSRIYKIWVGIRKRCNNPHMTSYSDYGGRGISVCARWEDFPAFYEDMADGYADNLTLERNDPNGNYEKSNCRWATSQEQARNKRNTNWISLDGVSKTAAGWQDITGVHQSTILNRIKNGWSVQEAVYGKAEKTTLADISQYLIH